jgi:hypothetical protein
MHAANEDELVHGPAYRLNRVFFHATFGMEQRDMRGEILVRQIAKALAGHRDAKRSSERPQPLQSLIPDEDERAIAGPASKADRAIEQDFERWRAYIRGGLTCHPGDLVWPSAEKEQRDVKAIRFDDFGIEFVGALEHACQPVDPQRRSASGTAARNSRPALALWSMEGYPIPEHTMNITHWAVKHSMEYLYCKMHYSGL